MPKKKSKASKTRTRKAKQARRAKRQRTGAGQGNGPITKDQYNAIWREYQRGVSAAEVARRCGLSHATVLKYIKHGDPKRDMEPLKDRRKRVQHKAREIADHEAVTFRGRVYAQVQNVVGQSVEAAQVSMADLEDYRDRFTVLGEDGRRRFNRGTPKKGRRKAKPGWDPKQWAVHLKNAKDAAILVQTWQAVFGDMIGWGDATEANEFDGWTVEELEAFAATGEVPERHGGGE